MKFCRQDMFRARAQEERAQGQRVKMDPGAGGARGGGRRRVPREGPRRETIVRAKTKIENVSVPKWSICVRSQRSGSAKGTNSVVIIGLSQTEASLDRDRCLAERGGYKTEKTDGQDPVDPAVQYFGRWRVCLCISEHSVHMVCAQIVAHMHERGRTNACECPAPASLPSVHPSSVPGDPTGRNFGRKRGRA